MGAHNFKLVRYRRQGLYFFWFTSSDHRWFPGGGVLGRGSTQTQ